MKRAVNCHDCIHNLPIGFCEDFNCGKGHKPRHFFPPNVRDLMAEPLAYGWKRKCGDYRQREKPIVEYRQGAKSD